METTSSSEAVRGSGAALAVASPAGSRAERFDRLLQGNLPLPLARLYARAHHAKGDRERHDHAFHLLEATLKLAAAALVARYRAAPERSEKADAVLRHLALPSLGQWRDIFRETLWYLGKRTGADGWSRRVLEAIDRPRPELAAVLDVLVRASGYAGKRPSTPSILDLLDLVPTYRNAMSDAHGSIKADTALYRAGTAALLTLVRTFVEEADALGGGRLVFAEEVRFLRPGEGEVVWMDLTGPVAIRRHPPEAVPGGETLLPGRLYLEILPEEHLLLHPLIYYQHAEMLDQVFFLNRARGGKSGVQFLSYETGEFYLPGRDPDGDQLVADLEALLSWITSTRVDAHVLALLGAESLSEGPQVPPSAGGGSAGAAAAEGGPVGSTATSAVPEPPLPGRRVLGDFEILGELGRGGMAIVYLARQKSLDRRVALKVLPPAFRDDYGAVSRFKREVRALARCDHPNVVKILSSGEAEGTYYYAMEYIDGADLAAIARTLQGYKASAGRGLTEGHFALATTTAGREPRGHREAGLPAIDKIETEAPPRLDGGRDISFRLAATIREATRGVQHIHEQGMIHRDLKPQNIMILRDTGQPVVMDLGLAKVSGLSQSISQDRGSLLGTLRYMAPEQLQRNLLETDARADVYSLGAVLYELLGGRPMLDGDTEERITKQILFEAPPPLGNVNPRIPGDLATIVEKATRKDPRERYATAAELADDLDRFVHGEAIAAKPPSLGYLLRVFARKHRVGLAGTGIGLLLLVVSVLSIGWYRSASEFRDALRTGRAEWGSYLELKGDLARLEEAWDGARARHETWEPVWEREDELEAWRKYSEALRQVDVHFNDALLAFHRARQVAWIGAAKRKEAERAIEDAYWDKYEEAATEGGVRLPAEYFELMIRSLENPERAKELEGRGTVRLSSDPPGADVWCFRHEKVEERLVPIPFDTVAGREDPRAGIRGEPSLIVESLGAPAASVRPPPFELGDRILSIAGRAVRTEGDLARALRDAPAGEETAVRVARRGEEIVLPWKAFALENPPADGEREGEGPLGARDPRRIVSFRDQLGVTFRAYPLDISAACRVGETRTEAPLELDLPRGSYLFVLRKAGRAEARLPVSVPLGAEVSETVELPEEGALPPGFLLVPAGLSPIGGDPEASQSLEYQVTRVGTFLMARCETTIGEYLEFLNDPETLARIEAASDGPGVGPGEARPLPECLAELPEGTRPPEDRAFVALVPALTRGLLFRRDEATGRWAIPPGSDLGPSTPVIGLSTLSALEYAAWRTRTSGGRWRYRLPTDIEWERAARGADRRIFVWGDYPIWSFTMSVKGRSSGPPLRATGTHPADESVFGIRDLAGSCSEPTLGKTTVRYRYTSLRGGSYYTTEDQYFRIANRNGRPPERAGSDTGIRLVAELRKPPKPNG